MTPALKDDYLYFFDTMIFKDNPDWSICYCYDYHFLGDVATCTKAANRAAIAQLIDEGKQTGYLVYDADKPMGWCNTNNRSNYARLLRDYDPVDNAADKVCAVVCYLIHPDYRRQGISTKLLERVVADCANTDYDYIEAYPRKQAASATDFKGPLALYERFGFEIAREHDSYYVVRKQLR